MSAETKYLRAVIRDLEERLASALASRERWRSEAADLSRQLGCRTTVPAVDADIIRLYPRENAVNPALPVMS